MALVIRLTRIGKKGEARYRIIVKEKRSRRDGRAIEYLGWYQKSVGNDKQVIKKERIDYWISQGAIPSATVSKIISL